MDSQWNVPEMNVLRMRNSTPTESIAKVTLNALDDLNDRCLNEHPVMSVRANDYRHNLSGFKQCFEAVTLIRSTRRVA
jgi:hypothetical protein